MIAEEIVWPWRMEKFAHDKTTLAIMREKLYDRGFDFKKLAEEGPPYGAEAAESIIVQMFKELDSGEVPWVMLWGANVGRLQALARLIPLGITLTTKRSCEIVTTARLTDLFFQRQPVDMWEDDPAGETVEDIKSTGTLVWYGVAERVGGAQTQTGKFAEIINHRVANRLFTVFTVVAADGKVMEAAVKSMGEAIGPSNASQVMLHSIKAFVKSKAPTERRLTVVA